MAQNPYFIVWAITGKCNLSCIHCFGLSQEELSMNEKKRLITEISALKPGWLLVEGGEVLLLPEIFYLLELMKERDLLVYLITNGMLLDKRVISRLKGLGVKVMVSIDGATPETYEQIRRGGDFKTVIAGIEQAVKEDILECINYTIFKTNYREIPQIVELASSIGVKMIVFIGLKPCPEYHNLLLSPYEYEEAIKITCEALSKANMNYSFDEPFFWPVVLELGLKVHSPWQHSKVEVSTTNACIIGDYLFIGPDGEVKPCEFLSPVLGNVREEPLEEIWHRSISSPLFSKIRDANSRTGHCCSCKYFEVCRGCAARTFALTGDFFASDPICPLSMRR